MYRSELLPTKQIRIKTLSQSLKCLLSTLKPGFFSFDIPTITTFIGHILKNVLLFNVKRGSQDFYNALECVWLGHHFLQFLCLTFQNQTLVSCLVSGFTRGLFQTLPHLSSSIQRANRWTKGQKGCQGHVQSWRLHSKETTKICLQNTQHLYIELVGYREAQNFVFVLRNPKKLRI